MKRFGRLRTVLLAAALGLVALVGVGWVAARLYLSSGAAARQAAEQLSRELGAPVRVASANVGLTGGTTLRGVELLGADGEEPVLRVDELDADVSALGLLGGAGPRAVELRGARLTLRYDRRGRLLTRLPDLKEGDGTPLPRITLRDGQITLEQEGRPALELQNITADLTPEGGATKIDGTLADPVWGAWQVAGTLRDGDKVGAVTFTSAGVPLQENHLRQLPFVPPAVWENVQVAGDAPVRAEVRFGGPKGVSYTVSFADVRLSLLEEGRKPFTLASVRATVRGDAQGMTLEGKVADPYWGDWTAGGTRDARTGAVTLTLQTPKTNVTQAKLRALPYVPASIWEEVEAKGTTPVKVTLRLALGSSHVLYRVVLDPRDTTVRVPSIELTADRASGEVVVEDAVVRLRDVTGRAAGGAIEVKKADLDFSGQASRLRFDLAVRKVALADLPRSWGVPEEIGGLLTGEAKLDLTVRDGKVDKGGTGAGKIEKATVAGFPTKRPIELELVSEGGRYKIRPRRSLMQTLLSLSLPPGDKPPPAASGWQPRGLAGRAAEGATRVAGAAAGGVVTVLARAAQAAQAGPTARAPSYLEAKFGLEDVDLEELLKRLKVKAPFPVAGKLSVDVQLSLPIDAPRDLKAYRLKGTADLSRLNLAGVELAKVKARVDYAKGVLRLEELSGQVPDPDKKGAAGTFAGSARLGVVPAGDLTADLKVDKFPLDSLGKLVEGAGGTLSGTVRASVPSEKASDPAAWKVDAALQAPELRLYGLTFKGASAAVAADKGTATLRDLKGSLEGAPVTGSATLGLKGDFPYQGKLSVQKLDLSAAKRLAPALRPPVAVAGTLAVRADLKGTLSPFTAGGSGSLQAAGLVVEGVKVDDYASGWKLGGGALQLSDIKAKLYKGEVAGSATVPLSADAGGQVDLRLKGVDAAGLIKAVPAVPVRLEGQVSGTVTGKLAAGKPRTATADVNVTAPALKIQGVPAERLRGTLLYKGGAAQYSLQGDTLGGKFKLEGKLPAAPMKKGADEGGPPAADGRLQIERIQLSRLAAALGRADPAGRTFGGVLSADLTFRHEGPERRPVGQGRFEVPELRYGDAELGSSLRGDLVLTADAVRVRLDTGTLAGGLPRLQALYNLRYPARSWFTLTLSGAEARRLLLPLSPDLADAVSGPIDLSVRSGLGPEWRGGGSAVLTRGTVAGVEVSEWRLPFDFTYVPAYGRGELTVRDSSAQLGSGRAVGQASLTYGATGLRVEGNLRLLDASLRSLAGVVGDVTSYAQGRVTGRADFSGSEVRSLNDLTANVQATLSQAQAFQLPVFRQLAQYVAPGQSGATFQSGELQGRLAGGVFRVQRLTLLGTYAQLIVQGNVTLQGRLDLDVTARTGNLGPDPLLLRVLRLRIPPIGPLPVTLLVEASGYLSNRVVRLHVTGTVRNPVIRIEPVRLLTEEVVRFFLGQALPL